MKKQINEIKRMQQLAGIITEGELYKDGLKFNIQWYPENETIDGIGKTLHKITLKKTGDEYIKVELSDSTPGFFTITKDELYKYLKANPPGFSFSRKINDKPVKGFLNFKPTEKRVIDWLDDRLDK